MKGRDSFRIEFPTKHFSFKISGNIRLRSELYILAKAMIMQ